MSIISKKAFAKINLGLQVLNKRPDGFHNINTIFYKTKLYDELSFELSDKIELVCDTDLAIPTNENLVYKAATKLQKRFDVASACKIILKKNIPSGGGLGGGSSDAATTLLALNELWQLNASNQELFKIALSLGSDIPYFLKEGTAWAASRGEKLHYFDYTLPFKILLVLPNIHIPTPWAFAELKRNESERKVVNLKNILIKSAENSSLLFEHLSNDFEKVIFNEYPKLLEIKQYLYNFGATYASMSGSGSAMYGLFEKDEDIEKAIEYFSEYKCIIA